MTAVPTPNRRVPAASQGPEQWRDELAGLVQGRVLITSDDGFDTARAGFDLSQQHEPTLLLQASSAADVVEGVGFARRRRLPLAVQATGHGTAGPLRGGLLLDTGQLRQVQVDPDRQIARIDAGARWADVLAATTPYGLAPLCGSAPAVGAVGYLLGGGLGPLGRRYGYGADRVSSLDLVTVDGSPLVASANAETELFWGMRGAGANFGVVTSAEIGLVPLQQVYGGGVYFPAEYALDVLEAFTAVIRGAPDSLSLSVAILRFPDLPAVPAPLRGRQVCHLRVCHTGRSEEAEELLAPLRAAAPNVLDTVAGLPVGRIGDIHSDPVRPTVVDCRSEVLATFDAEAAAIVARQAMDEPSFMVELRHLGGALAGVPEPTNAVGHRRGVMNVFTSALPGTAPRATGTAQEKLLSALTGFSDGGALPNFLQGRQVTPDDVRRAYDHASWGRLVGLKQTWDPENHLNSTRNISVGC